MIRQFNPNFRKTWELGGRARLANDDNKIAGSTYHLPNTIASFIQRDGDEDDDDNDTGYTIGTTTTTTAIATPATSTTSATTTTTKQQPPQSTTTTTTTTTTSCTCKIPYITGCSCMIKGAYAYAHATCNMQYAHAAGHAVYLPSPRLTPFASFRLATPNCMYLCMPIARANPNPIRILPTRGSEDSTVRARDLLKKLYCTDCLEVVCSGSIHPSSELIDFEKFTNFIKIR